MPIYDSYGYMQLERVVGNIDKLESFKNFPTSRSFQLNFPTTRIPLKPHPISGMRVIGKRSWKKREIGKFLVGKSEVGKFPKNTRTERSWKVSSEVRKFR